MARKKRATPKEVFLSHSSKNRRFVDQLAADLRRHGIAVWYSATDIVGAEQWHDEIGAALQRCDWFAVVLSPSAVTAPWVKRELLAALNDLRFESRIVPILYRRCNPSALSWTLPGFQQVDFRRDYDKGLEGLLRIWGVTVPPTP